MEAGSARELSDTMEISDLFEIPEAFGNQGIVEKKSYGPTGGRIGMVH